MSEKDRAASIRRFQEGPDDASTATATPATEAPLVFLASVGAAGVGITLTRANHVFLMEPGWNPQAEAQAVDRVHRFGQRQKVRVLRLVARDTIEAGIREYAATKMRLANVVLDRRLANREDRRGVFKQLELMLMKGARKRGAWRNQPAEEESKEEEAKKGEFTKDEPKKDESTEEETIERESEAEMDTTY
jgi:SNF2 family DNA or RNA helicase